MTSANWLIRAPNHLGDVVMALPAIRAHRGDVLVTRWLAPILEMAPLDGDVIPFDRGFRGWRRVTGELRRRGYSGGVLLTPAFSAAWLMRWGGVRRLRGTATDGRSLLLEDRIPVHALRGHHRIDQYRLLLGQETGVEPGTVELSPPSEETAAWRCRLPGGRTLVGLFPGANAPARRWPAERFAELAKALSDDHIQIVVLGGEAEKPLTSRVAAAAPPALDLGGATGLRGLAAVLSLCSVVVTNDTGPMHLASAVGTRTVTVWGPSDPGEVRPTGPGHRLVRGPVLPCKPCFKNDCPRVGVGTHSPDAHEECMRLIATEDVVAATRQALAGEVP